MREEDSKLFGDALKLPPEARAALASILIESLDASVEPEAVSAWSDEIERRVRELDRETIRGVPWNKARRAILGG